MHNQRLHSAVAAALFAVSAGAGASASASAPEATTTFALNYGNIWVNTTPGNSADPVYANFLEGYDPEMKPSLAMATTVSPGITDPSAGQDLIVAFNQSLTKEENAAGWGRFILVNSRNVLDTRAKRTTTYTIGGEGDKLRLGSEANPLSIQLETASAKKLQGDSNVKPQNIHKIDMTNALVHANITHKDSSLSQADDIDGGLNNELTVRLENGTQWFGNLVTDESLKAKIIRDGTPYDVVLTRPANALTVNNNTKNTVKIDSGSVWTGMTSNLGQGGRATNVELAGRWNVRGSSNVTMIRPLSEKLGHLHLENGSALRLEHSAIVGALSGEADSAITLANGAKMAVRNIVASDAGAQGKGAPVSVRFEGFDGTQFIVVEKPKDGVPARLVAVSGLNDGKRSSEDLAKDLLASSNLLEASFAIEGAEWTDAVEGKVSAEKGVTLEKRAKNANVATISDASGALYMQWRAEAEDARLRMGDLRSGVDGGVWGRAWGGKQKTGRVGSEIFSMQFGTDRRLFDDASPLWLGAALSYTESDQAFPSGKGDSHTTAVSVYALKAFENGSFIDATAKFGSLHSNFNLGQGVTGKAENEAYAFSVEGGHRFALSQTVFVEPQLAYSYSNISGDNFRSAGVLVQQSDVKSSVARAGMLAGINAPSDLGNVYVRLDYLYEFDGKTSTRFGTVNSINRDFGGGWYELGLGGNLNLSKSLNGYAEVKHAAGGELDMPWRASVGLRWSY